MAMDRRSLLGRGVGALVAYSGLRHLERLVPEPEALPEVEEVAVTLRRSSAVLAASGGLCAPVTPYYSLEHVGVASRPLRDALPSMRVRRDSAAGLTFSSD